MFIANGKTYFLVGDKVTTPKFAGAPAVVVKAEQRGAMGEYFYTLEIDVSNHADGYDENGEKIATLTSFCAEWEVAVIAELAAPATDEIAVAMAAADVSTDAAAAKFEFYDFCEAGPGAHAATVLAKMGAMNDGSRKYWKRALACARLARTACMEA